MGKIYAAKTNHITNPLGFYLKPLVFSWKVKGGRGTGTETCKDCDQQEQNLYRYLSRHGGGRAGQSLCKSGI